MKWLNLSGEKDSIYKEVYNLQYWRFQQSLHNQLLYEWLLIYVYTVYNTHNAYWICIIINCLKFEILQ